MTFIPTPQPFSTNKYPSLDQYLRIQRKKNLGYKNPNLKKFAACDFSRDPGTQQTMLILLGVCDQDNLADGFLCLQPEFCRLYRGRGGRSVRRQAARDAMGKAELEGLLRIIPERTRYGWLNWLYFTEKAIQIINDSKLLHVGEEASNPCVVPCTVHPTEYILDMSCPEMSPDLEVFNVLNDVWSPPEKQKDIKSSTRLPKAPIAKPRQKSNYKSKVNCSWDALVAASNLMVEGGYSTFLKGDLGLKVKQDFNRRFGLWLEKRGFNKDLDSAMESGLNLMIDLRRANLSSDQAVATQLDDYFNGYGIKATKKIKAIIGMEKAVPEPAPEPTEEPKPEVKIEEDDFKKVFGEKNVCVATSFSEDELVCLKDNLWYEDWITKAHYDGLKKLINDIFANTKNVCVATSFTEEELVWLRHNSFDQDWITKDRYGYLKGYYNELKCTPDDIFRTP